MFSIFKVKFGKKRMIGGGVKGGWEKGEICRGCREMKEEVDV